MKIQNTSKYSPICIRGVTINPKQIVEVPGLTRQYVNSTPLSSKIRFITEKTTKKAPPKRTYSRKISPVVTVEPEKEESTNNPEAEVEEAEDKEIE